MFDFRLHVFHTVATRLNFTRAASELYISQPAVTKHIQEIEQHFKLKLFERNGTRIRLTAAGETLLQHTAKLVELYGMLEFDMNSLLEKHKGRVRIGASTTAAQYILPMILGSFHQKFPDAQASLVTGNTVGIEQALESSSIDLGIVEGRSRSKFRYTEFLDDRLVLVCRASHPRSKKAALKPQELPAIPMLLREPGSGTLEVIGHALKGVGIRLSKLSAEMQLESTESIKTYLQHSDCMAFLSVHSIRKELENGELVTVEVNGLEIPRKFYFIRQQGQSSPLTELFIRFAQRYNFR